MNYQLEVPFDVVQEELKLLIRESAHTSMDRLREQYLNQRYEGIANQMRLQIDGQDVVWDTWSLLSDKLKQENQFLKFQVRFNKSLRKGAHQISVWNRNHEEDISIYRTSLSYEGGVWIDACDVENPNIWSKEETMREIRMSIRILPNPWGFLEQYWLSFRNERAQRVFEYRGKEEGKESLRHRILRRELSLWEGMFVLFASIILASAYPFEHRKNGLGWVLLMLGIAMMLNTWGDNRLWLTAVLSILGIRYPVLFCILWIYLSIPIVGLVCILPAFVARTRRPYSWIWCAVILLSFFCFIT